MAKEDIVQTIASYVLDQFLPGENPEFLKETTSLISGGILNSIDTLKLVSFLEERYGIEFEAHEINMDCLDNIASVTSTVVKKLAEKNGS
jgi:acyl carrier protein